MSKRDYREVLGFSKGTSDDEIKRTCRRMARKYHPDVSKDSGTGEPSKEVNEVYKVLSDPQEKVTCDQFGHVDMNGANLGDGAGGFGGFEDPGDIFSSLFGGGFGGGGNHHVSNGSRRGNDRSMQTRIEFMDAISGKTEIVTIEVNEQCDECTGSGMKSKSDIKSCPHCNGTGTVTTQQKTSFGVSQSQSVCPGCNGTGKTTMNKYPKCHGKGHERKRVKLNIKTPVDIQSGQQVRVLNKGERGMNGESNGDLRIEILMSRRKQFVWDGNDIHITVPINTMDAILGCKVDVPTVYGDMELTIPADTQFRQQFRLKGKGVKPASSRDGQGDQYVEVKVEIPIKIICDEKELYEKIRNKESHESPFDKFREAFK